MKYIRYTAIVAIALTVTGCGIFKKYKSEEKAPEDVFGNESSIKSFENKPSLGEIPWKEIFVDPYLQALIDTALVRNVDLSAARLDIEQANAVLKSAKLGYAPSFSFSPSFTALPGMGYSAPVNIDWGVNGFGSITNRKREAEVLALQAIDIEQTVRSQIVASVAKAYYHLQMLDREDEILRNTLIVWGEMIETMKAYMENGKCYSTSVNQMKASLLSAMIQKRDIENEIKDVEGALCLLLAQTPQSIARGEWSSSSIPAVIGTGIPASILENRADVRAVGRQVEAAYYVTNQARCAMLPSIDLTGLVGWASSGQMITNPGQLIYNAVLSLTQPIFQQGKLKANLKVSKARQQQAAEAYTQKILEAGNEVNSALRDCLHSRDNNKIYDEQVAVLLDTYNATTELMSNGKASYIEVLIAQESLLEAQLSQAINMYSGTDALVSLYVALGGGVK